MKKVLIGLSVGASLLLAGAVNVFAGDGLGIGVTLSNVSLDASGTETEGGETNSKSLSRTFQMGSLFAEFTKGPFTVGINHVPFKANVSDTTLTRTDTETSGAYGATAAETSLTQLQAAQARILDHNTVYAELGSKIYAKVGYVSVTVETQESLGTGSTYGNVDLDGFVYGLGIKGDWDSGAFAKLEAVMTDYDSLDVTSGVARAGVSTNNKITADLDTTAINLSMGYKF